MSKTERKINGINNNGWYNARQDRTHDLSIVGIYELSNRWTLSTTFVYQTGNAVTFPTGKFNLNGVTVYQYANRNANRLPAYHRLDFGATYEKKNLAGVFKAPGILVCIMYMEENAYTITFRDNLDDPTKTEALQTSLFRWVPGITYNFKF